MRKAFWILAALGGAVWSLLAWFAWTIAGAGGAAVLSTARWLDIDPLNVVWLADTLDAVGSVAQVLVLVVWLIGIATLALITWLGVRAAAMSEAAIRDARIASGDPAVGRTPALEGQVQSRTVAPVPAAPGEMGG